MCECVCVRVCEEFITYKHIMYILNLIGIVEEFRMVPEFLILGLQKYFLYAEQ